MKRNRQITNRIWLLLFKDVILAGDSEGINIGLNGAHKHRLSRFADSTGGIVSGTYDRTVGIFVYCGKGLSPHDPTHGYYMISI